MYNKTRNLALLTGVPAAELENTHLNSSSRGSCELHNTENIQWKIYCIQKMNTEKAICITAKYNKYYTENICIRIQRRKKNNVYQDIMDNADKKPGCVRLGS